jgi:hypothetical protein
MTEQDHLRHSADHEDARSEQRRTGLVGSVVIGLLLLIAIVVYALLV